MIAHLSIPQYLLESSFCLVVFYAFYHIALRKSTEFQLTRFYLLLSAAFSLIIPILNIELNQTSHVYITNEIYPMLTSVENFQTGIHKSIAHKSSILHISLADLITTVYLLGAFLMTMKLANGLFKLYNIIRRCPKQKNANHTMLISDEIPASSFFSYIFWSDVRDKNDVIQNTIMEHELVHVRQRHSLDVVLMELMVIVKWFNPLIYLFRNSLQKTHEFIADRFVTDKLGNKMDYAKILLKRSNNSELPPLSHGFYGNIKERIEMLSKESAGWRFTIHFVLILPLTLCLMGLFAFDLSDKLPDRVKSPLQNVEQKMLAAAETNLLSLYQDPKVEDANFYLNWAERMDLSIQQEYKPQTLRFSYKLKDLDTLFTSSPRLVQNGKNVLSYIDTIYVIREDQKINVDVDGLKDPESRKLFLDELKHDDIIKVDLKGYSQTDSLSISLELIVNQNKFIIIDPDVRSKKLRWGEKEISLSWAFSLDNPMFHEGMYIELHEVNRALDHKIEIQNENGLFDEIPSNYNINFKIKRANSSELARINTDMIQSNMEEDHGHSDIIYLTSYYHGRNYKLIQETKTYSLDEFYSRTDKFKEWFMTLENGDMVEMTLLPPEDQSINKETYNVSLRFKDESEALNAPFPITLPHTVDSYERFQIVMNDEGNSYVRVDKSDPANRKIVKAYEGSASYTIIDIPGFKTKERVKRAFLPHGVLSKVSMPDVHLLNMDVYKLNDYYSNDDDLIRIDWGKMVSMPNIGNYSMKEFKRSSRSNLELFTGNKSLEMIRYDLVIIPESGKIKRIRTDIINYSEVIEELSKVEANTSIYVDNIILDVDGMRRYYPYNFVFTVE